MIHRFKLLWVGLFCISIFSVHAQTDSLRQVSISPFQQQMNKIYSSKAFQMTYIGMPLIIGGLIVKSEDDHFRSLRNDNLYHFKESYDNYTQYLPAAVMLGMKMSGVQSRSSWGRMLTSDAFSIAILSAAVNQLKTKTQVMRPDGSDRHSFPSGHTATAFMTATMFSKEYGEKNPWYSIGAYSVATVTGLTRMANNKHWLSDIMVGAGIGIISTELGYYFADLIFKDKGIHHYSSNYTFDQLQRPSFFGINLGFNIIQGSYRLDNLSHIRFSSGSHAGLEGAYFFNPYVGIGGSLSTGNMRVILNDISQDESLDFTSEEIGTYFSYPLTSQILLGSKLLTGYTYYKNCQLNDKRIIGGKGGISMNTGCSITLRPKEDLGVKFFLDYNLGSTAIPSNKKYLQFFTLGSSVSVTF